MIPGLTLEELPLCKKVQADRLCKGLVAVVVVALSARGIAHVEAGLKRHRLDACVEGAGHVRPDGRARLAVLILSQGAVDLGGRAIHDDEEDRGVMKGFNSLKQLPPASEGLSASESRPAAPSF